MPAKVKQDNNCFTYSRQKVHEDKWAYSLPSVNGKLNHLDCHVTTKKTSYSGIIRFTFCTLAVYRPAAHFYVSSLLNFRRGGVIHQFFPVPHQQTRVGRGIAVNHVLLRLWLVRKSRGVRRQFDRSSIESPNTYLHRTVTAVREQFKAANFFGVAFVSGPMLLINKSICASFMTPCSSGSTVIF